MCICIVLAHIVAHVVASLRFLLVTLGRPCPFTNINFGIKVTGWVVILHRQLMGEKLFRGSSAEGLYG